MSRATYGLIALICLLLFSLALVPAPAQAGFWDKLKKVQDTMRGVQDATRGMGGPKKQQEPAQEREQEPARQPPQKQEQEPPQQPAKQAPQDQGQEPSAKSEGAPLPGGAAYRLKKLNKELDRAEARLDSGKGSPSMAAGRAQRHLRAAQRLMRDIKRRYGRKIAPDHPQLVDAQERMNLVAERIKEARAGSAPRKAASTPPPRRKPAAAAPPPADKPETPPPAKAAAAPLPRGAQRLLSDANRRLDTAQRSLDRGNTRQAKYQLGRVRGLLNLLQRRYGRQVGPNNPEVAAVTKRVDQLEVDIAAAGQKAAPGKKKVKFGLIEDKAASSGWVAKFKPYITPGDPKEIPIKEIKSHKQLNQRRKLYGEAKALYDQMKQQKFPRGKSMALQRSEQELRRRLDWNKGHMDSVAKYKLGPAPKGPVGIVFSRQPINPANPQNLTDRFKAGDRIYGLIQAGNPWRTIYKAKGKKKLGLMCMAKLDGKKIMGQYITLKKAAYIDRPYLVLDVAPSPGKMTAYRDPAIVFNKGRGGRRVGPMQFTYNLGKLGPGKHRMQIMIWHYGKAYVQGAFTIEGSDYSAYQGLYKKLAQTEAQSVTLPQAKMIDKALSRQMRGLLQNAGWQNIVRLNIVDKGWWFDRVSGGQSPIKSKHIAAAVLAKGSGGYFYKRVTFHRDRLITGGYGNLYISHTGKAVPVPAANINK